MLNKIGEFLKKYLGTFVLVFLIFILFFHFYYGIFHYNYLVPPGDDPSRHMTEAQDIINSGFTKTWQGSYDPPLFHTLLALETLFTGQDMATVTLYIVPLFFILSYLALYYLARRLFHNQLLALLTIVILLAFSLQPDFAYTLGTYLNLMGGLCFFIFGLAFLKDLYINEKIDIRKIALCFIFFGGVALTHSLSTSYMILTLLFVFLLLVILKLFDKFGLFKNYFSELPKIYFKNFILTIAILLVTITPLIYTTYGKLIFTKTVSLVSISSSSSSDSSDQTANNSAHPVAPHTYVKSLGVIMLVLFIISLPFLMISKKYALSRAILLSWVLALFIASRFAFFILPYRFVYDLAYPFSIIIAYCLVYFLYSVKVFRRSIFKIIFLIFLSFFLFKFIYDSTLYIPRVRLQTPDEKAIYWISNNVYMNENILAFPKTVARKDWGSYINILTGKNVIPAHYCPEFKNICPWIFNPQSKDAKDFYKENKIDYIYAGEKVFGYYENKNKIDWNYQNGLSSAPFLSAVFEYNDNYGKVVIYKVDRNKL